jgi:GTP-binding protein HflX
MDTRIKAILIDLIHPRMLPKHGADRLDELEHLVNTYGGIVVVKKYQKRFAPHPRTFIGPGKIAELGKEGEALGAQLLIVNNVLKPQQSYQIGEMLKPHRVGVWDRIDLILKIFAKHARTTEAKLEIELASIRHMGPRIFGMGMELSRQGGGIGTMGIGETNIERMKRHLREKEHQIREKLERYQQVREGHRKWRTRQHFQTVAIVGYTNAGKTTLLNAITGRKEYAADELFATLDTRVGQLYLPGRGHTVLVSDTIGFIKHLPHELINAFSSTLSEAVEADFLLHVVDASDPHAPQHVSVVNDILIRLGIAERPRLIVLNKSDGVEPAARRQIAYRIGNGHPKVWISAEQGDGLSELVAAVEQHLPQPVLA